MTVEARLRVLAAQPSDRHRAAHDGRVTYALAVCKDRASGCSHVRLRADLGLRVTSQGRGASGLGPNRAQTTRLAAATGQLSPHFDSFFCSFRRHLLGTFYEDTKMNKTVPVLKGLHNK